MSKIRKWGNQVRDYVSTHELSTTAVALLVIAFALGLIGHVQEYGKPDLDRLLRDFYANASSELASIVITVLIIDRLNQRRQDRRETDALKKRLIREMGSKVQAVSINATEQLFEQGWLRDGTLSGVDLREANLSGATLIMADLHTANLREANLRLADLREANLSGANLSLANLGETNLSLADLNGTTLNGTNLGNANLTMANLRRASLRKASLRGASLRGVDLRETNLAGVQFSETTTLPDNTKWTPDTDTRRFTDPDHPDFWRPDSRLVVMIPADSE